MKNKNAKPERNRASPIATAIALGLTFMAQAANSSPQEEMAGIRLVGQMSDGTLVLDDATSGLSTWETAGVTARSDEEFPSAPTLLTIGIVDSWDPQSMILMVSGQATSLAEGALIIDTPRDINAPITTENVSWYLRPGAYIAVAGYAFGPGQNLATHIVRMEPNTAFGSSPIYVRGVLEQLDVTQGIAIVGKSGLDLAGLTNWDGPGVGNVVEVFGYGSTPGRVLVAEYASLESATTLASNRPSSGKLAGISGSGLKGISGSGLKGISGSGLKGISGSGLK